MKPHAGNTGRTGWRTKVTPAKFLFLALAILVSALIANWVWSEDEDQKEKSDAFLKIFNLRPEQLYSRCGTPSRDVQGRLVRDIHFSDASGRDLVVRFLAPSANSEDWDSLGVWEPATNSRSVGTPLDDLEATRRLPCLTGQSLSSQKQATPEMGELGSQGQSSSSADSKGLQLVYLAPVDYGTPRFVFIQAQYQMPRIEPPRIPPMISIPSVPRIQDFPRLSSPEPRLRIPDHILHSPDPVLRNDHIWSPRGSTSSASSGRDYASSGGDRDGGSSSGQYGSSGDNKGDGSSGGGSRSSGDDTGGGSSGGGYGSFGNESDGGISGGGGAPGGPGDGGGTWISNPIFIPCPSDLTDATDTACKVVDAVDLARDLNEALSGTDPLTQIQWRIHTWTGLDPVFIQMPPRPFDRAEQAKELVHLEIKAINIVTKKLREDLNRLMPFQWDSEEVKRQKFQVVQQEQEHLRGLWKSSVENSRPIDVSASASDSTSQFSFSDNKAWRQLHEELLCVGAGNKPGCSWDGNRGGSLTSR